MTKNKILKVVLTVVSSVILIAAIAFSQSEGPSNLQAMANGNSVSLTWSAPSSGAVTSYNIYKATSSDAVDSSKYSSLDFTKVNSSTTTTFQDSLASGSSGTIVYYVTAVGNDGTESSPSNYAKVTLGGQ